MDCSLCNLALYGSLFLVLLKFYLKCIYGWCYSYTCLVGKTAIVTGANSGIGYYTALDLAKRGCRVILACRNEEKAEIARERIIIASNNNNVSVILIDMESLDSVRQFAKTFNETEDRLDILVNNAGGFKFGDRFTKDHLQVTMQVNHFSSVLLTELLLEKLKQSAPSKIVNVSSIVSRISMLTIEGLNKMPRSIFGLLISEYMLYCNSKLCNIFFTMELAKRLNGTGVSVNALHPGAVLTQFARNLQPIAHSIFRCLVYFFFKSPEEGAQTTIYVCVAKEEKGVSGGLFQDCKQIALYQNATNSTLAKEVWEKSRELVGLTKQY